MIREVLIDLLRIAINPWAGIAILSTLLITASIQVRLWHTREFWVMVAIIPLVLLQAWRWHAWIWGESKRKEKRGA